MIYASWCFCALVAELLLENILLTNLGQRFWKELAWNGIRFKVPFSWEICAIDAQHLMLEETSEPVMEIKWRQVKENFSHQAQLHQLTVRNRKHTIETVSKCSVPSEWKKALGAYESIGFSWQGNQMAGVGVILYCPQCRNATMLQFYKSGSRAISHLAKHILASFQDHSQENWSLWSVFDIRARIPRTFRLVRHCFETGEFKLIFEGENQKITLYRWAPASVLLSNGDLVQFANTRLGLPLEEHCYIRLDGINTTEWETSRFNATRTRLWDRILPKPSCMRFRLWHLEHKNRIMGVRVEGQKPIDSIFCDRLVSNYECL
jgi:hypothetical protein